VCRLVLYQARDIIGGNVMLRPPPLGDTVALLAEPAARPPALAMGPNDTGAQRLDDTSGAAPAPWGFFCIGAAFVSPLEMATGRNPSGSVVPYPHPLTLTYTR
jgi:hypothetical protein